MELKKEGMDADVVVPSEYWKDQGPVPVKFTVRLVEDPLHIVALPEIAAVGLCRTVIENGWPVLAQPVVEFIADRVPL
jgi:hypothetical protein